MADRGRDPYGTLGVDPAAPEAELRAVYRRQVQRHHPDHNGGSVEAAHRFEEIQEAYAQIRSLRAAATRAAGSARAAGGAGAAGGRPVTDYDVQARLADLERELRAARQAREQARDAARRAAAERVREASAEAAGSTTRAAGPARPSDQELGYISTDDSFTKILADAASELSGRLAETGREHQVPRRLADLIDELGAKLTHDPPGH